VAKYNQEISDTAFRQAVVNTLANTKNLYFDLLAAIDNLEAQRKSLELARKLLEENRIKVRVGTLAPLDVVEAVDGSKPLFQCTEVRRNCVLFADAAPPEAVRGVCAIHQVMLDADKAMRAELANRTLLDISATGARKIPFRHIVEGRDWFHARAVERSAGRTGGK